MKLATTKISHTGVKGRMRKIVEACVNIIRQDVVIPYIRVSERAKRLGMTVDVDGNLHEIVDVEGGLFPDSIYGNGHDLINEFDTALYALVNSKFAGQYETVKTRREIVMYEMSCGNAIVPFANWRSDCSQYLHSIAKDPKDAVNRFMADKDPWTLFMSVRSLCNCYFGTIPDTIELCLITLVKAKYDAN